MSTTVTADIKPFEKEIGRTVEVTREAAQKQLKFYRETEAGLMLNAQRAKALGRGMEAVEYAAEAAAVRQKLFAAETLVASFAAEKAAVANEAVAVSQKAIAASGVSMTGVMRELLVIFREIGRGNWARIPGSFTILFDKLGLLKVLLSPVAIGLAAVAAEVYAIYWAYGRLTKLLSGLKVPDFDVRYIAKHEQAANHAAEAQKELNKEVVKTVELYESAAEAAQRVADATREHFEHLRKMNSFEKDSKKRRETELRLNEEERKEMLRQKAEEAKNLEAESKRKQEEAAKIQVASKEHDDQVVEARKQAADDARKQANDPHTFMDAVGAVFGDLPHLGQSAVDAIRAEDADKKRTAHQREMDYRKSVEDAAKNEEVRRRRAELEAQATEAATKAAKIRASLPNEQKKVDQKNKDEREEAEAAAMAGGRERHGHVNDLQRIGAYTSIAVDVQRQQLKHLASIDRKLGSRAGMMGANSESSKIKF